VERKHFASNQISQKLNEIDQKFKQLKDLSELRSFKLQDALEVQMFYTECSELITWLHDKEVELKAYNECKNEMAALSHTKKLEALKNDIKNTEQHKVNRVMELSANLQKRNHYDKKNITRKQAEIQSLHQFILDRLIETEQYLNSMLKIFEFQRECETTINWIKDQQIIASSEDYGKDLEHAESLVKRFNEFMKDLDKNVGRVRKIDSLAQRLCENKYTPAAYIELIDERCSMINEAWNDLNTIAEARRQTLDGAIEVHAFDKDCDDLIQWAIEKETFLKNNNSGYDLASVHTLVKQQEALEIEFTALGEELERLNKEADRLCKSYPETKDHIEIRLEDADSKYNELLKNLSTRRENIFHSQGLFVFLNGYNELSDWLRETLAAITSYELANDVPSAEHLLRRHKDHKTEIDLHQVKLHKFCTKGEELLGIRKANFHKDVRGKLDAIQAANRTLIETWQSRQDLYEQNLEFNKLSRDIKLLDDWLTSKDSFVHTDIIGDSLTSVDSLLKQHVDFEKMLEAMDDRFESLKRETKLEKAFKELRARELQHKQHADQQFEVEKKKENERKKKIEKRRQEERRRTQEIIAQQVLISLSPTSNGRPSLSSDYANKMVDDELTVDEVVEPTTTSLKNEVTTGKIPIMPYGSLPATMSDDAMMRGEVPSQQKLTTSGPGAYRAKKDRNRTRSIRDKYKIPLRLTEPLLADYLHRKQELQKGGQRAPIRDYQLFYTTLHSNLMCFFIDKKDYNDLNAACQPINLYNGKITLVPDTLLQRYVVQVETADGAEYSFDFNNEDKLNLWAAKMKEARGQCLCLSKLCKTDQQYSRFGICYYIVLC
jgi:spectrin beta